MHKYFILIAFLFGVTSLSEFSARAQSNSCDLALVESLKGDVTAFAADGALLTLTRGMRLCDGVRLRTAPTGGVKIQLLRKSLFFSLAGGSEIVLEAPDVAADVSLIQGILHFLSSKVGVFAVKTRYMTAGIEGTEAVIHIAAGDGAVVAVREGEVTASRDTSSVAVVAGEVAFAAPAGDLRLVDVADAQALPPVFRPYVVNPDGAVDWAIYYPPELLAPRTDEGRAAVRLLDSGKPDEALALLDCATPTPRSETAALCMIIAVARNDRDEIRRLLAEADGRLDFTRLPGEAAWRIAASYGWQALGDLRGAEAEAEAAVALAPKDPFARARLAEVLLLRGSSVAALDILDVDESTCGPVAHVEAIAGFARLAQKNTSAAIDRFECAIQADPGAPLGRLGRGLALIRNGDLSGGRADLEAAVILDPRQAALRTWLGRAYLEEGETKKARGQFALARSEDPDDPNTYLFSALERYAANDPIGALRELEAARDRRGGAASVRDSRGLGEDDAVNNVALGRVYQLLGFDQLAVRAATDAVAADPTNPGAHRFLADAYAGRPGFEVAQTSERLQADLYSGPTNAPLQVQFGETNLGLLEASGPARVTFREFSPLFETHGPRLAVSALAGNRSTIGDELSISFLHEGLSLAVGQFHYETEGFGENNDLRHEIGAAQARVSVTPWLNLFGEVRARETDRGEFEPADPGRLGDTHVSNFEQSARIGGVVSLGAFGELAGLFSIARSEEESIVPAGANLFDISNTVFEGIDAQFRLDAAISDKIDTQFALLAYDVDRTRNRELFGAPQPEQTSDISGISIQGYFDFRPTDWLDVTIGAGLDVYESSGGDRDYSVNKISPKIGVVLRPIQDLTLRAAYFEEVKRHTLFDQSIDRTMIAGFNRVSQNFNGAKSRTLAIGADLSIGADWQIGAELVRNNIDRPVFGNAAPAGTINARTESSASIHLSGHVLDVVATSVGYERFERESKPGQGSRSEENSDIVFVSAQYRDPSGFYIGAKASHVAQRKASAGETAVSGDFIADAVVGYRFPNRLGEINVSARNIFDQDIDYQEPKFRVEDFGARRFSDRFTVAATVVLNF